jgi:hypothetical protein
LRRQEQKEQHAEKLSDEHLNKYQPMVPRGKEWRAKPTVQSTGPVELVKVTGLTGAEDRSDRQAQPVRPVEPVLEQTAKVNTSISRDEVPAVPTALGDEELVDYEASLAHSNMEINVVRFSKEYYAVLEEEEAALLDFGPREAVFQKPKESDNHLKALYMRGHINGRPISRMLFDGGAIVNLMPYSLYKKLGGTDEDLIKTNMTVSGVGEGDPIGARRGGFHGVDRGEHDASNSLLCLRRGWRRSYWC